MISVAIPGFGDLELIHLVCDFNGTLALDGRLLPGIADALAELARDLRVHVITADTNGSAARELHGRPVTLELIPSSAQSAAKRAFAERLGAGGVVAIGNGRNDRELVSVAALGIAVMQGEGAAPETLVAADVVVTTALDGLRLLRNPHRLVATLRD